MRVKTTILDPICIVTEKVSHNVNKKSQESSSKSFVTDFLSPHSGGDRLSRCHHYKNAFIVWFFNFVVQITFFVSNNVFCFLQLTTVLMRQQFAFKLF